MTYKSLWKAYQNDIGRLVPAMLLDILDSEPDTPNTDYKRGVCDAMRYIYLSMADREIMEAAGFNSTIASVTQTNAYNWINKLSGGGY